MKLRMSIIALALGGAIAHAGTMKQAPAEVTPFEAQRWVSLFDQVVDTVVADHDDCGKMATRINALVDANQPTIAMAREARSRGKKLPASAQQHMLEGVQRMIAVMDRCRRDDRVTAAFRRLDFGRRT